MKVTKKRYEATIQETGKKVPVDICYCCNTLSAPALPCMSGDMIRPIFKRIAQLEGFSNVIDFGIREIGDERVWGAIMTK